MHALLTVHAPEEQLQAPYCCTCSASSAVHRASATNCSQHLSLHQALTVGAETVQGTAAVHDAGWAHMDLKPDNTCMEIEDGLPHSYLVDFGSSLMQGTCRFTSSCLAVQGHTSLPDSHL